MQSHRFDPISFVFGVLFVGVAAWVIGGGSTLWSLPAQWVVPGMLFGGGLLLLGSVVTRALQDRRASEDSDDERAIWP